MLQGSMKLNRNMYFASTSQIECSSEDVYNLFIAHEEREEVENQFRLKNINFDSRIDSLILVLD